jgi:hypothetical protein
VSVNGVAYAVDSDGRASFITPNTGAVVLTVEDADGKKSAQAVNYALTPAGLLVEPAQNAAFISRLLSGWQRKILPELSYCPALISAGATFGVFGQNFQGKPGLDEVRIDGMGCDVTAGSSISLLVTAPSRLHIGPLKEIYVSARNGESSNVLELDVAKVETSWPSSQPGEGKVMVMGTNMPALVRLDITSPGQVKLSMPDGLEIGNKAVLVTPGGDANAVSLVVNGADQNSAGQNADILPDLAELVGDPQWQQQQTRALLLELTRARLIRLKVRLIGVESRIAEERQKREQLNGNTTIVELEKMDNGLKALSVRQSAISTMLSADRALYDTLGGSEIDFRQSMDDAAGGAYYVFEKSTRETLFVPSTSLVMTSTEPNQVAMLARERRRFRRLPEPRMKLLPPMDMQVSLGADANQVPSTTSVNQVPSTTSVNQVPPSMSANQVPPAMSANQVPPSTSENQVPPAMSANQVPPATSVNQVPSTTSVSQVPPATSVDQVPPATGVDRVPPATSVNQVPSTDQLSNGMGAPLPGAEAATPVNTHTVNLAELTDSFSHSTGAALIDRIASAIRAADKINAPETPAQKPASRQPDKSVTSDVGKSSDDGAANKKKGAEVEQKKAVGKGKKGAGVEKKESSKKSLSKTGKRNSHGAAQKTKHSRRHRHG